MKISLFHLQTLARYDYLQSCLSKDTHTTCQGKYKISSQICLYQEYLSHNCEKKYNVHFHQHNPQSNLNLPRSAYHNRRNGYGFQTMHISCPWMHTLVTQLGKLDVFTENITRWMRIGLVRTFRPENAHVNRCSQGYATMAVDLARLYTCNLSYIANVSHHRGSNFFLDHMRKHLIFTKTDARKVNRCAFCLAKLRLVVPLCKCIYEL